MLKKFLPVIQQVGKDLLSALEDNEITHKLDKNNELLTDIRDLLREIRDDYRRVNRNDLR